MDRKRIGRTFVAGLCAGVAMLIAAPAHAQMGSVHGRVVDEAGKPVPAADVAFDCVGEQQLHYESKTDSKGEFTRAGLRLGNCHWTITATKGNLTGKAANLDVPEGNMMQLPDLVVHGAAAEVPAGKSAPQLSKVFSDVTTFVSQNNFDGAINELNDTIKGADKCGPCYVRLGDTYYKKSGADTADDQKKADLDHAEESYQKTITLDDKTKDAADAYGGLVTVYNAEHRFDDAGKANDKQSAILAGLTPAGATSGGGGDATAAYNSGVILWNQTKIPEAEAQFSKAIQMKPDMADAHYYLGMCYLNEGKNDDAKKAMQQYLQLAPNGANAAVAKSVLDSLK